MDAVTIREEIHCRNFAVNVNDESHFVIWTVKAEAPMCAAHAYNCQAAKVVEAYVKWEPVPFEPEVKEPVPA